MALKKTYIIGHPLEHSLSPDMHNHAYQALGLDYFYEKLELPELNAKNIAILRQNNCLGANITIPHKKTAAKLVDEIRPSAPRLGLRRGARPLNASSDRVAAAEMSINTIVNENGKLIGYSTDGPGYLESLKQSGIDPAGKNILIYGTGGAAQAIIPLLKPLAEKLTIVAIESPRPDTATIKAAELIINATPIGMYPKINETVLPDISGIHSGQIFSDIVYNPRETLFLRNAAAAGAATHQGWGMLLYQGVLAFCLLTDTPRAKVPIDIMRQSLLAGLA